MTVWRRFALLAVGAAALLPAAVAQAPGDPPPLHPAAVAAIAFVRASADPAQHRPEAVAGGPYAAYLADVAWPALLAAGPRRVAWAEAHLLEAPAGDPPRVRVAVRYALDSPRPGGGTLRALAADTLTLTRFPDGWKVTGAARGDGLAP